MKNYRIEVIAVNSSNNNLSSGNYIALETFGVGFGILISITTLITAVVNITLKHTSLDKQINAHVVECGVYRKLTQTILEQIQKDIEEIKQNTIK